MPRRKNTTGSQAAERLPSASRGTRSDRLNDSCTESLDAHKKQTKEYLAKHRKPLSDIQLEEALGPLKPCFDELWTEKDERTLQHEWRKSKEKKEFENVALPSGSDRTTDGRYGGLQTAWKITLRLYQCSPFSILSPRLQLQYKATPSLDKGAGETTLWSQQFCNEFAQLIAHPVFHFKARTLAAVLQFAVICRTGDRRIWSMRDVPRSLEMDELRGDMEKMDGRLLAKSVHSMHRDVRRTLGKEGVYFSLFSDLLYEIGRTVRSVGEADDEDDDDGDDRGEGEEAIYQVTLQDLRNVREAINALSPAGFPILAQVKTAYQGFLSSRGGNDVPVQRDGKFTQLSEYLVRSWLHEKRCLMREKRAAKQTSGLDVEDAATDDEMELGQGGDFFHSSEPQIPEAAARPELKRKAPPTSQNELPSRHDERATPILGRSTTAKKTKKVHDGSFDIGGEETTRRVPRWWVRGGFEHRREQS